MDYPSNVSAYYSARYGWILKLKEDAISDVMESGMPAELIEKLGQRLKVIGIAWNNNVKQIGSNLN